MSMKGRLGIFTAMAAMFGGMGGMSMQTREPQHPVYKRRNNVPTLRSFRHTGEIPKGCKLETVKLVFTAEGNRLSIDVDIIYASPKARQKKIAQVVMEIGNYLQLADIRDVLSSCRFVMENMKEEKDLKSEPNPEG